MKIVKNNDAITTETIVVLNWFIHIKWKNKTRVTSCELRVQIYELRVQIYKLRVQTDELQD